MSRPAPVEIVPYDERWPGEFSAGAARLRRALGGAALRLDHIGSTAVPGLAAKDVIDVQVAVSPLEVDPLVEPFARRLRAACGERARPQAAWADESEDGWRKTFFRSLPPARRANVHVRAAGAPNTRHTLLFRDYLRAHEHAAQAYAALKRKVAGGLESGVLVGDYADLKDPGCDIVLAAAEDWARAVGWRPGPSDA